MVSATKITAAKILANRVGESGGGGGEPAELVTWNPLDKHDYIALSNGDLTATKTTTSGTHSFRGTKFRGTGKFYFEILISQSVAPGNVAIGIGTAGASLLQFPGFNTVTWAYHENGRFYHNSSYISVVSAVTNDVIMFQVDLDAGTIRGGKNGTWFGAGPQYSNVAGPAAPMGGLFGTTNSVTGRFAAADFSYSPPAGYLPWES